MTWARKAGIAAVTTLLLGPAVAWADQEIRAAPPNQYATPQVTVDQGEPLFFRNSDIAAHDVTHDAEEPLFRSELVGQGESSFVEGSQYLVTGTYAFLCSVHPDMKGTLTVTEQGTPHTRPGAGGEPPAPDTQEPAVALELRRYSARRVRRTRRVGILVGADEASRLAVTVFIGSRRAGRARLELAAAGTRRIQVRLSRRLHERIRPGRRLVVLVRAVDAAGNAGSDERSARLR